MEPTRQEESRHDVVCDAPAEHVRFDAARSADSPPPPDTGRILVVVGAHSHVWDEGMPVGHLRRSMLESLSYAGAILDASGPLAAAAERVALSVCKQNRNSLPSSLSRYGRVGSNHSRSSRNVPGEPGGVC